jgi:hypothetical protein
VIFENAGYYSLNNTVLHLKTLETSLLSFLPQKLANHSKVAVLRTVLFWIMQHALSHVVTNILEEPAAHTSSDTEYEAGVWNISTYLPDYKTSHTRNLICASVINLNLMCIIPIQYKGMTVPILINNAIRRKS